MHVIINDSINYRTYLFPWHDHQVRLFVRGFCYIHGISSRGSTSGNPATMPPPPSVERKPSYIQFTPKRSLPSFENLVALANYEERLKDARKIVWRDRGELPVEIHNLWECLKHATRGGLREFKLPASP